MRDVGCGACWQRSNNDYESLETEITEHNMQKSRDLQKDNGVPGMMVHAYYSEGGDWMRV